MHTTTAPLPDHRFFAGIRRIVGNPSRVRGEYKALMITVTRPSDGFKWGGRGQVVD